MSIKACHRAGIASMLSTPMTSNAEADSFDKIDFIHIAHIDECRCPARERAATASRRRKADCSSGAPAPGKMVCRARGRKWAAKARCTWPDARQSNPSALVWPGHTWIQVEEVAATVFIARTASSYASSGPRYTGEEVFCP